MSTVKSGAVGWNEDFGGDKKKKDYKDYFLKLQDGENNLRFVTEPFQYIAHKVKKDPTNKKDFGRKIGCSQVHGSCPLCDEAAAIEDKALRGQAEAKAYFYVGVIDLKSGTYKVLDFSTMIYNQIKKLSKKAAWGDPQKFDLCIEVDPKGGPAGYYTVSPLEKRPLSAAEQLLQDNADIDDLKRRTEFLKPETVTKRVEALRNGEAAAAQATGRTNPSTVRVNTNVSDEDDTLEQAFPSYDAS